MSMTITRLELKLDNRLTPYQAFILGMIPAMIVSLFLGYDFYYIWNHTSLNKIYDLNLNTCFGIGFLIVFLRFAFGIGIAVGNTNSDVMIVPVLGSILLLVQVIVCVSVLNIFGIMMP